MPRDEIQEPAHNDQPGDESDHEADADGGRILEAQKLVVLVEIISESPAIVGMARKNENSAAARFDAPNSIIAPTIVAPERDTPGIIAMHWKKPIFRHITA